MKEDWVECTLGEIVIYSKGKKPKVLSKEKTKDLNIPYINIKAFEKSIYDEYTDGFKCNLCNDGDLLMVWDGARSGLTGRAKKGAVGSTLMKIEPSSSFINKEYLYYFLSSKYVLLNTNPRGVGIPHVEPNLLWNSKFIIHNLPIQRAIVAKIEELFSSLDSGIADLTKAQKQLVVYRQAVLKKAFEGEYPTKKIIEIADVKTGATPKRGNKDYWDNGTIPWVTSTVVNSDYVNEPSELITERAIKETNCKIIPKGSLLVAMYGEGKTRGKCSELNIDTATNQALAGIILLEENKKSKQYVKWFFIKNYEEMRLLSSGGVQPNLNLSIIRNTVIPFPNLKEQHQIVREIESRLSVCDKVEESIAESLEKAKALRQSILKKAFEGKLLSEEEIEKCKREKDYEPAHILLERIRSEKKKKK